MRLPSSFDAERPKKIISLLTEGKKSWNVLIKDCGFSTGSCAYWIKRLLEAGKIERLPIAGAGLRPAMIYYKIKRAKREESEKE